MKPSFALNLSHDGLSLLRRAKGGWQVIGSVALDDPELNEKLGYLRKTATQLASGQLASKLVIPNSQILYRTLRADGTSDAERRDAVRRALEGLTPYPVDELAFDWVDAGDGMAHVAAVARDTLDEAETFATEHGFNPVSFVAIPTDDEFVGEPFFGPTGLSEFLLPESETIESDPGPVVIVGDHDPETATETTALMDAVSPDDAGVAKSAPNDNNEAPVVDTKDNTTKPPDAIKPDATKDAANGDLGFSTNRSGLPETGAVASLERVTARFALYADKAKPANDRKTGPDPAAAGARIAPMPLTNPTVAGPGTADKPADKPADKTEPKITAVPKPGIAGQEKSAARLTLTAPQHPYRDAAADSLSPNGTASSIRSGGRAKYFIVTFGLGLAALLLAAVWLTGFFLDRPVASSRLWGGFNDQSEQLISETLTTPQIVASIIEPLPPAEQPASAVRLGSDVLVAPRPPVGDITSTTTATRNFQPSLSQPDGALNLASLSSPDRLSDDFFELSDNELAESEPGELPLGEMTVQEASIIHRATGIWVLAPIPPLDLTGGNLDDLYIASIDRRVESRDAIALPATKTARIDTPPGEIPAPPVAGIRFDLDERGFVRATVDGALSVEGVVVFLGKPGVVPKLRPENSSAFAAPEAVASNAPTRRPIPRPANLLEQNERAQLGGLTRNELARRRPVARPASPQITGTDASPTELAVLLSRTPRSRPDGFTAVVEKARALAQAAAVSSAVNSAVASAAAVAPVAPPPSTRTVAAARIPSTGTTAVVAREATIENAISLAQINLIGVYGSSSDRRALIRLKNGRYQKVQIGDRLDGGKVAVIEGDKLQYIKSGRVVTLEIAS